MKPDFQFLEPFLPYCVHAHIDDARLQFVYRFSNGLGASVIWLVTPYGTGTYGAQSGLWELALVEWSGDQFELSYDYFLSDVAGHLTGGDVVKYLRKISKLVRKN